MRYSLAALTAFLLFLVFLVLQPSAPAHPDSPWPPGLFRDNYLHIRELRAYQEVLTNAFREAGRRSQEAKTWRDAYFLQGMSNAYFYVSWDIEGIVWRHEIPPE